MPRDKPFFHVPWLPPPKHNCAADGELSGKLNVTITAKTPLHFGAGQLSYDESASLFVNRLNREDKQIALPGSGFKGMLRSVFEALSESCMPTDRSSRCLYVNQMCSTCAIFGLLGSKGKLRFSSFFAQGETMQLTLPQLYSHPASVNQRRFYRHSTAWRQIADQARGKRYECLPPGAVLEGCVTYQNLTEDQLGGLLFALGLGWGEPIFQKLGYAKPAYLGSVQLTVAQESMNASLLSSQQELDLEQLAAAYYEKHKPRISEVVDTLGTAWNKIGGENDWNMQTLTY